MLTGRESLIRLVGKRRKYLPNRQSLLSTPIQRSMTICKRNVNDGAVALDVEKEYLAKDEKPNSEWVTCPVCGKTVHGDNYLVNSHLDACLARGTKRKLSQRTLLQLNFCSRSKVGIHCSESSSLGTDTLQSLHDNNSASVKVHNDLDFLKQYDRKQLKLAPNCELVSQTRGVGTKQNPITDDSVNCRVELPKSLFENETAEFDEAESFDDVSGILLDSFVVGRRFGDEVDINAGSKILFLRDPHNVKDPNAIKVFYADFEFDKVIGFLPRELAQYLSPLMDLFCLRFEGHITSVPNEDLAVVPIQIVCQSKISCGEIEHKDLQIFKSLWKHALIVVESAKTCPPGKAKYQHNFVMIVQEVLRISSHLFTLDEKAFLESFNSLSDDSQRLFVRLYMRKGPWFRLSNISYPEIFDSELAMKGLFEAGYIISTDSINELHEDDLKQVLNVLNVEELREILCTFNKKRNCGTRKQDCIDSLLTSYKGGLCPLLLNLILKKAGACIRVSSIAEFLIWRAERLFFLNGEQDLSAFLLVDLGILKYPTYNCIVSDQIFSLRSDLLCYEEAIELAQIMDESLDDNNSELVIKCIEIADSRITSSAITSQSSLSGSIATFSSCISASWVYSKVALLGVSFLEREKRYVEAIYLLRRLLGACPSDGRRGYWTIRLSIDLEHMGNLNESLLVAENGLEDPWVRAGSRIALQRRVLRLGKPPRRWKTPSYSKSLKRKIPEVHVQGRPLNCETGMKSRFYGEDGELCGVEELALQYYAGEGGGWQGVHTESGIWLTIFGLLMWDIIFADVPNAFHTRFQTAPLDMESDIFYETRKTLIEPLLKNIQDGMAEEILITSWESHFKTACRGVSWSKHSLSELRAAVTCIGGPCLASICRHLAQDYRSWSRGMPDLLLWRFHKNYRGEAKLVEVKGPRDRLSEQQHAWLLFLMDCGFNTEVCKVSPSPITV